jgi:flagellar basal body-associated protein FliL
MKKLFHELGLHGVLIISLVALLLPAAGIATLDALDIYDIDGSSRTAHSAGTRAHTGPAQATPAWLDPLNFVAPTFDGHVVTLQVAIDAPDKAARRALSADKAQLILLLKLQVGTMLASDLKRPEGIERLTNRMLNALRDYVGDDADDEVIQVRQVAIGNLVVRRP